MKFTHYISIKYLLIGIYTFSLLIFLAHLSFTKTAIYSDGRFYFVITRSIVKDFDIKFANEFEALGMKPAYTIDGYSWNKYPPGVSFFWLPLFFVADGITSLVNTLRVWIPIDTSGYGLTSQIAAAMSSIFLGVLGLYFVYRILRDYFSKEVSLMSVFALFTSTNLLFYIAVEPITPHTASFFISSLFVYYFLKCAKDKYYYLILGIIGGLAGLVRTQDLVILILPAIQVIISQRKSLIDLSTNYLLLATGAILAFAPQIYFWKKIFGTLWYSPYLEEGFNLLHPQIIHVLFNSQNGLFTITPIIAATLFGILALKLHTTLKFYSLAYFLLQLYLISSWSSFYQGGSFGIRMMITTYPLLAFGMGHVIATSVKRFGTELSLVWIFLFSITNSVLIIRYLLLF